MTREEAVEEIEKAIELVIKIPEEDYRSLQKKDKFNDRFLNYYEKLIVHGTPLPKGHGGLISVKDAVDNLMKYKEIGIFGNYDKLTILGCIDRIKNHVEPIIEADKAESEDKE